MVELPHLDLVVARVTLHERQEALEAQQWGRTAARLQHHAPLRHEQAALTINR